MLTSTTVISTKWVYNFYEKDKSVTLDYPLHLFVCNKRDIAFMTSTFFFRLQAIIVTQKMMDIGENFQLISCSESLIESFRNRKISNCARDFAQTPTLNDRCRNESC